MLTMRIWLPGALRNLFTRPDVKAMLPENSGVTDLSADQLAKLLGDASLTAAGVAITPEVALKNTTVYGCVSLIAGAISTLPLPIYERQADGSRKKSEHEYWWIFNERASERWTSSTAFDYLVSSRLFYGDGFARIIRPNAFTNRASGWQPIHPTRVEPYLDSQNSLRYRVTERSGGVVTLLPEDILHVPSMGFDGIRSPSPITYAAREAIGAALAAEEFTSRFFGQGSTHDIALKTKKTLVKDQIDALRTSYLARYAGGKNARTPLILTGDLEVEKLSITPADASLLATRQFGVEEICRVFGVPPFMVGATDKTTSWGSGIEQQGIAFVKYTLRRHLTAIEQEFNSKLWPNRERYFVEYLTAALERGDFKTRMEGYRIAIGRAGEPGWMTPNEARRLENMEPAEGGDRLNTGGPNDPKAPATPG